MPDGPPQDPGRHGGPRDVPDARPGTLTALKPLTVQTGAGTLVITQLQPPGSAPMDAAAFLNGAGRGLTGGHGVVVRDSAS
jgi:methionyl-tRNA formyltransferase